MDEMSDTEKRTVRLDMDQLFSEARELVGDAEASRLWTENNLDSAENWPGKWATAMEIIQKLRAAAAKD
jgi:hypothetical protein